MGAQFACGTRRWSQNPPQGPARDGSQCEHEEERVIFSESQAVMGKKRAKPALTSLGVRFSRHNFDCVLQYLGLKNGPKRPTGDHWGVLERLWVPKRLS